MMTNLHDDPHRSTRHHRLGGRRHRSRALLRRCRLALVLVLATEAVTACLPLAEPWIPTDEDTGPDSGPDPDTCEYRRDCSPVVK
ncbi:MAG: hypothetical protein M3Y51_00475 [Actinomycetota bacterium]|nr:hypothetical protein [Actinomycetota bacterium]